MAETFEPAAPVIILETSDPAVLAVAKSLLEDADIDYAALGDGLQVLVGPGVGAVRLQVSAEDAEDARELLRELQQ